MNTLEANVRDILKKVRGFYSYSYDYTVNSFTVDQATTAILELIEGEVAGFKKQVIDLVLDDVPHLYQSRLLEILK